MSLDTFLHLVTRLKVNGAVRLFSSCAFMTCTGSNYFYLIVFWRMTPCTQNALEYPVACNFSASINLTLSVPLCI